MDSFVATLQELLDKDFPDWSIYDPQYGSSCLLECPHGNVIEQDGRCPQGCVSPMRTLGLI